MSGNMSEETNDRLVPEILPRTIVTLNRVLYQSRPSLSCKVLREGFDEQKSYFESVCVV